MRWILLILTAVLAASCQTANRTPTSEGQVFATEAWPQDQAKLQPGPSESGFKAPDLSAVQIQAAADDVDPQKAAYLGVWKGYLCSTNRSYDVQIAVISVTNDGADYIYSVASTQDGEKGATFPMQGRFVNGNLQRVMTSDAIAGVNLRLRDDGNMDVQWVRRSDGRKCFGVLERVPGAQSARQAQADKMKTAFEMEEVVTGASIYLLAAAPDKVSAILAKQTDQTIMSAVQSLTAEFQRENITSDERYHSALFVFRQPLKAGTRIRTEHQFTRPGQGSLRPYQFYYTVSKQSTTDPYLIINRTNAGGIGGTITYRAYIDRKKVAETVVSII